MALKNSEKDYGLVARTLHWAVAVGIWTLIYLGLQQSGLDSGPERNEIRATHASIALLVFVLMSIRLAWRFIDSPPAHSAALPGWQTTAASLTHWGLYVVIFGQLVAGVMTVATTGKPIPFFELFSVPLPVAESADGHHFWEEIHENLWIPLAALLTVHVAAVVFNTVVRKSDTLRRMTTGVR